MYINEISKYSKHSNINVTCVSMRLPFIDVYASEICFNGIWY